MDETSQRIRQQNDYDRCSQIFQEIGVEESQYGQLIIRKKCIIVGNYNTFLADLTSTNQISLDEVKSKMTACGEPGDTRDPVENLIVQQTNINIYFNVHFHFHENNLKKSLNLIVMCVYSRQP